LAKERSLADGLRGLAGNQTRRARDSICIAFPGNDIRNMNEKGRPARCPQGELK
jgi:hypothetical protein